jgi:hypothetical protein
MATYTLIGHPLNPADLATTPGAPIDPNLLAALRNNGVGATITLTLTAPEEAEAEANNVIL